MICLNSDFLKELIDFWFSNKTPQMNNSHLIFAITTLIISIILVLLNYILIKTKGKDLLNLKNYYQNEHKNKKWWKNLFIPFLWIVGSFLISFILTTTEIVNIKIISSVIIGFTWDKLFIQLSRMNKEDVNINKIEQKDDE